MTQTFLLPWPVSCNAIWRAYRGRNILSQPARAWNDIASKELAIQRPKPITGPVSVTIELSPPTKRSYDLDNRIKICLDLMVRSAIIEADNASIVRELHVSVGTGFTGARVTVAPAQAQEAA